MSEQPTADRRPTASPADAARAVRGFAGLPILIVGDVMLDQFVVGRVNRISPEAPVPVVEFEHDEYRAGGAANVAGNVRSLGGKVGFLGAHEIILDDRPIIKFDQSDLILRAADLRALLAGDQKLVLNSH